MSALTATTPPPPPPPPSPQSVYARYEAPAETAPAASDSSERFTEDSLPDLGGQAGAANSDEALEKLDSLSGEVREMRTMLQSQLASLAWANMEEHHPRQAELFRQMLALGLSPALCRQLVAKLPDNLGDEAALKWAKLALVHNLKTIDEQDEIIARGGVYALVGPTGIGKTTTVAKLAARATLRHGTERIALITTDSYRIGAQDQLRLYGKILGVSVFSVQNEADLHVTLADLADKHLVLIDSTGMGQRDARVDAQTQMYAHTAANGGRPISRVLVLAANAEGATLEDVVNRYLPRWPGGLRDVQNRRGADLGRRHRHHHPSPFAIAVCDQWPARAGRSPPGQVQLPD
jgi:flagellar biosynthesis protein FlhF